MEGLTSGRRHRATVIERLPYDVVILILSRLDALSLLNASLTSSQFSKVLACPEVWSNILKRQYDAVLGALFNGAVPQPRYRSPLGRTAGTAGEKRRLSWKQHYFDFGRSWKLMAQEQAQDRLVLLKIHSSASAPLAAALPWWHRLMGRLAAPAEAAPAEAAASGFYGVYDATSYAISGHPGLELILYDAAEEEDSTEAFANASHSEHAKAVLRRLAVPGLEELPCITTRTGTGKACACTEVTEELTVLDARRRARRRRRCARAFCQAFACGAVVVALGLAMKIATPDSTRRRAAACLSSFASSTSSYVTAAASQVEHLDVRLAPWLCAILAVALALWETSVEGVFAFALFVFYTYLYLAARCGALSSIRNFFVDCFHAPVAMGVLATVPAVIALSKQILLPRFLGRRRGDKAT